MVLLKHNWGCQRISWISSHQMMVEEIGPNQKVFKKLTSMIQYKDGLITLKWLQILHRLRKKVNVKERRGINKIIKNKGVTGYLVLI